MYTCQNRRASDPGGSLTEGPTLTPPIPRRAPSWAVLARPGGLKRPARAVLLATLVALPLGACVAAPPLQAEKPEVEPTQVALELPPPGSSANATATFQIKYRDGGATADWTANVDTLGISVASVQVGDAIEITATLSGHALLALNKAGDGFSIDSKLNTTPYWPEESALCQEGVTGEGALSAIGVMVASSVDDWRDYSLMPYCGLNWSGYNLFGPNGKVDVGDSAELIGDTYAFTVLASPGTAAQIASELIAPAGWMFSYPRAEGVCGGGSFGAGEIIHTTTPVCPVSP